MTTASCLKPMIIDLNIGDQLTSISCGHVVVELIKFIVYQRLQIPYSYQWLKQVITKKKECQEKKDSFQSERHFRIASTALENLDLILKSLLKEIDGASIPEEVCVALGATPMTCKEMYRFLLPSVCHKPQCHSTNIANDQKIQRNVFKTLVTSEKLSKILFDTLPPTNMFVFMKKKAESNLVCDGSFVSTAGCRVPRSAKIIVLDLNSAVNKNLSCCNDFQVFGDVIHDDLVNLKLQETDEIVDSFNEIESNEKSTWFQSNYIMKGFKDCIVNGNSVTSTWLES